MGVKVTGQFVPAGDFSIVDGKDVSGALTGSYFSGSAASTGSFGHLMLGGGNFTSASLAAGGGSFNNFTVTADDGSNQTIDEIEASIDN